MELSRRDFLKFSGAGMGAIALFGMGTQGNKVLAAKTLPLKKRIGEKTTICPYDASGCGFIVAAENGKVVNIEGDPDHPINRGAACAKGSEQGPLPTPRRHRLGGEILGLGNQ